MCEIFSKQPAEAYTCQTRSVRLCGHATSIRLEGAFWEILEEISESQGMRLGEFLTKMYIEVLDLNNGNGKASLNFSSLLRCACLTYASKVRNQPPELSDIVREFSVQ